ncbi:hypothetical protein MSG28_000076 [Choristoneura fumiferana]|uniref:Uncharacterized protein n=1 Tax=Choristoneura fumiferana TaxID=7141 RepID=A0ACC0JZH5_CHOFU|nr:hypothetical protein MSG28_000076 [Choristoneura fumiferana]
MAFATSAIRTGDTQPGTYDARSSGSDVVDQLIRPLARAALTGHKCENIEEMENYLLRTGVTLDRLDQLSVIHVAGTKGKRVRLSCRVLKRGEFARHFHRVYDMLYGSQAFDGDMPKYFAFLTVMAFNVFLLEAVEVAVVECPLTIVPEYATYNIPSENILQVNLPAFQSNASLAVQLAHAWLKHVKVSGLKNKTVKKVGGKLSEIDAVITGVEKGYGREFDVPIETVLGLKECRWPGRYQKIEGDYATFYLDGAHTAESMVICAQYQNKILIFSATGDRDVEILLKPLTKLHFKVVFFVIPTAFKDLQKQNDNYSKIEHTELISRCSSNAEIWKSNNSSDCDLFVMESVSEALISIKRSCNSVDKSSVLITGSLHLVGAALSIIDPSVFGENAAVCTEETIPIPIRRAEEFAMPLLGDQCCKKDNQVETTIVVHEHKGCCKEDGSSGSQDVQVRENSPQITCCHSAKAMPAESQEQIV